MLFRSSREGVKKATNFAKEVLDEETSKLCSFICCSAERLPFRNGAFTKVISISVMEHIPDDKRAFDEIERITKAGGKVFIYVPNTYKQTPLLFKILGRVNDRRVGHLRHYQAEEIIQEFEKMGFILDDLMFYVHNIKILQWILYIALPWLRDSRWLWKLEERDLRQKADPHAAAFSIAITKR